MSGKIDVISLGCSKNLVESEKLLRRIEDKGYSVVHDPENPSGDYVVVNTCGFISDAKEESIKTILELCSLREKGQIGKLVVMGCLSQRYLDDLKQEIPEVDAWYGKFDWQDFIDSLPSKKKNFGKLPGWERKLTTPPFSAYLKISEGCDRFCAFCTIPLITGRHKSREINDILDEVRHLVANGVREFNIIAQDLSSYGIDLYGSQKLAELIDKIADIKGVEWIRLHYAYPKDFPLNVLDVMAKRNNVCKYLDIALQHIADPVLYNMRRHIDKNTTLDLLKKIREKVPGIKIRTTLMTGFPGEGESEFNELIDFVKQQKFERLGAFAYSPEDDTFAFKNFADPVPDAVKLKRLDKLMALQEEISLELNQEMIGQIQKVLVEGHENGYAVGRTQYDSPEVDPEVLIKNGDSLSPGEFVNVRITDAFPFELIGEIAK